MTAAPLRLRLSALDSAFLTLERDGLPLHVGAACIFEGGPLTDRAGKLRRDDLCAHTAARLGRVPRLRARLAEVPGGIDRPRWVDDPEFDIGNHVEVVDLGDDADDRTFQRFAEERFSSPLDRRHPLWHLAFATGLPGGRVGLVERVHHALVDGVSDVEVALALLDLEPAPEPEAADTWRPGPGASASELLIDGVRSRILEPAVLARDAVAAVRHPLHLLGAAIDTATGLAVAAADGLLAPHDALNAPVGGARRHLWVEVDLAAVRAVGASSGATVNDVLLAAVTSALRTMLLRRGEPVPLGRTMTVLVPVSVRSAGAQGTLGNRVSMLLVRLPVGIGDPAQRLRVIAATTSHLKVRREAAAVEQVIGLVGLLPPRAVAAVARASARQPFANLVVTNVPGPDRPLYLMGARMLQAFPFVPLGGNLSFEVAALSYDGKLRLGVTADPDACPDVDDVVADLTRALLERPATHQPPIARSTP